MKGLRALLEKYGIFWFMRFAFRIKDTDRKTLISDTLFYALNREYDYIIFSCSDSGAKFCQFALKDSGLLMDIATTPHNYLFPYMKRARRLLEEMGFSYTDGPISCMKFKYEEEKDVYALNAGFGTDTGLAADFVVKVFEDIYNENLSDLKIQFSG